MTVALLVRHIRAQNRIFWRAPVGAFFTVILPLMMLVLFVAIFGNDTFETSRGDFEASQFYTPGLAVFSAAGATFTNLGINLAIRRDEGILRRVRGTPLPPWIYMAGAVGSGVFVAFLAMSLMVGFGVVVYGVNIELAKLPAMFVSFLIGSATFAVLGIALASLARSASSAPALANAIILPMAFFSDVFLAQGSDPPDWLTLVGDLFPLRHFVLSFSDAMSPFTEAPAFTWERMIPLGLWALLAALVAWRRFTWEPAVTATTTRGRRRRRR